MGVSRIELAQTLANALADPFAAAVCPFCLLAFSSFIKSSEQLAHALRPDYHAFWTALAAFVAAEWTTAREETVASRVQEAGASCYYHSEESPDIPRGKTFFGVVYSSAATYIHEALVRPKHPYQGFGRKPWRWPATQDQLFPHGPERAVRALASQVQLQCVAYQLLHDLLHFHRPLIFPALLLPDVRAPLVAAVIYRWSTVASAERDALAALSPSTDPVVRTAVAQEPMLACQNLGQLFLYIFRGRDALPGDKARFCAGHEVELFRALDAFFKAVGDDGTEIAWMGYIASHLWILLSPSERRDVGYAHPPPYAQGIECDRDLENPYRALRLHLRNRPRAAACSGPSCTATIHDGGARLAMCGRCQMVWYCSRECQREDWARGQPAHKEVCAALQELSAFTPLDAPEMTPEQFAAACAAHAFPQARVELLIRWATRGTIATRYALGGESPHGVPGPATT